MRCRRSLDDPTGRLSAANGVACQTHTLQRLSLMGRSPFSHAVHQPHHHDSHSVDCAAVPITDSSRVH